MLFPWCPLHYICPYDRNFSTKEGIIYPQKWVYFKINKKIHTGHSKLKIHNYDLTLRYDYEIVPQPYHPAAQDWLPTEG